MNFLAGIFKTLVVKAVTRTWTFIRRHPLITLVIIALVLLAPFVAPLAALWQAWLKLKSWMEDEHGEATTAGRLVRRVVFYAVLIVVPGGFVLWALAKVAEWLWRESYRNGGEDATLTVLPDGAWQEPESNPLG